MSEPAQSHPFYFMGRKLGSYDSVDIYPETGLKIYNFEPEAKCKLPAGTIFVDIGRGVVRLVEKGLEVGEAHDIIEAIASCDRVTKDEWDTEEKAIDGEDSDEDEEDEG